MLVISRKLAERVMVYPNGPDAPAVVITLVDIDRNKVRLGIDAPRDMAILREELIPAKAGKDGHP